MTSPLPQAHADHRPSSPGATGQAGMADGQLPASVGFTARTARRTSLPGETLAEKFWLAVQQRQNRVAIRQKHLGIWREMTWEQVGKRARAIAMALVAHGFRPGDAASILANTCREWTFSDFGILLAGGISSGIYPTDAASQVEYLMTDSASSFIFLEDEEQLDKILAVRDRLLNLRKIIVFDMEGLGRLSDPQVISLAMFEQLGEEFDRDHPEEFDVRRQARKSDDVAILVYTSGTTGKPKGAMLTHRNLCWIMEHFAPELDQNERDSKMAFLPLCHIAERMIGQMTSLETGSVLNYVENPETIAENIQEIQPTVFMGVPRVWEKFYSAVSIRIREATPFQRWAYKVALSIGQKVATAQLAGQSPGAGLALANKLGRFLVLDNVRRAIGIDRLRWAITGAAPISPDLIRWYWALGVPLYEGYGMTESSAGGSINLPGATRLGSVGKPQPFNDIKLSEDGEILIRGPNIFSGYLNLPDKTREAFTDDGWYRTGDVGVLDADGFIRITDRMKDIIITAGGKNITPSELENELKFSPYITDAVVIGDRRAYLTVLVMIDHENVERYAQDLNVPFTNFSSLCRTREVQGLIQAELDRVNQKFARVEQIKKFRLIEHKLTAEDEELTPTMKLKRKLVNEKYKNLIEDMYRG